MKIYLPSFSLSTILDVNEVEIVSAVPWKKSTNGTIIIVIIEKLNTYYDTKPLVSWILVIDDIFIFNNLRLYINNYNLY